MTGLKRAHLLTLPKDTINISNTSDYVLDETYTLLRLDVGHKRAVEFGYEIKELQRKRKINVFDVNQVIFDKAWKIFEKYSDKDFSFTDCSSFAVMEMLKINEVSSFDKHFDQYGFIRLPTPKQFQP